MRLVKLGAVLGLISMFTACSKDKTDLLEGDRGGAFTDEALSRVNLIRIYSVGALEDYFTSIDFGVEKYFPYASGAHECRLLEPKKDALRSRAESPAHLYMNKTEDEFKNGSGTTDANDVFYAGDNNNRNGRTDSYEWTQVPTAQHLQFRRVWQVSQGEYRFFIHFDKGGATFSGNVKVKTTVSSNGCETAAYMCTNLDSSGRCLNDEWPIRFKSIVVSISVFFYPWGNYITKIEAVPYGGGPNVVLYD